MSEELRELLEKKRKRYEALIRSTEQEVCAKIDGDENVETIAGVRPEEGDIAYDSPVDVEREALSNTAEDLGEQKGSEQEHRIKQADNGTPTSHRDGDPAVINPTGAIRSKLKKVELSIPQEDIKTVNIQVPVWWRRTPIFGTFWFYLLAVLLVFNVGWRFVLLNSKPSVISENEFKERLRSLGEDIYKEYTRFSIALSEIPPINSINDLALMDLVEELNMFYSDNLYRARRIFKQNRFVLEEEGLYYRPE